MARKKITEEELAEEFKFYEVQAKIQFIEPILGTANSNPDIYTEFIGSKAPDASTIEDEVATLGADEVVDKGTTIFHKGEDGRPFLYAHMIKGFCKTACGEMRRVPKSRSSKITAFKKRIDEGVTPLPIKDDDINRLYFTDPGQINILERPLRAMTMQGERVSLARSEMISEGTQLEFKIVFLEKELAEACINEWLPYGMYHGLGQWRNSGKGRFRVLESSMTAMGPFTIEPFTLG